VSANVILVIVGIVFILLAPFVDALPTDPRTGAASFDISIGKTPYRE
jgi:hypothetical protein